MPTPDDPSVSSMFVWLVRIALPIIFFFIWYTGNQGKGDDYSGSPETRHTKADMLQARAEMKDREVPETHKNLKLIAAEDPRLPGTAKPTRGNQAARAKRGDKARLSDASGKGDGKGSGEALYTDLDGGLTPSGSRSFEDVASLSPVDCTVGKSGLASLTDEERMHYETMLNFVANFHKDQPQRFFLPTPEHPPPLPRSSEAAADSAMDDGSKSLKANVDAQMILKGASNPKIGLKHPSIAKDLHQHLSDSEVKISEQTFTLMVEACISGGDLPGASNFLMKMESAGLCPDNDLLDKVMDLYSESRTADAAEGSASPAQHKLSDIPPWANASKDKKAAPPAKKIDWSSFDVEADDNY